MEKLEEISLNCVKSSYVLKLVLSFFYERKRLNLIKYNKKLQEILGVNIEMFKKISGRYIIGEKNGKGKEYMLNSNTLIFEGDYLNWKRNGKGKEYDNYGDIVFEGEYLNGKKWKRKRI